MLNLGIREPGLNVLPLGVERHVINGGGLTGVQIFPQDEIEIINDEGNQICEITVFNKDGKSELAILNLKEKKDSKEIIKILSKKDESSLIAAHQLKKRNLDISKSRSATVFDKEVKPGEKIKLVSSAGTGHYYTTSKNKRTMPEKMEIKKYDPVVRKHVIYKEAKIK